jgi:hypothetical protein
MGQLPIFIDEVPEFESRGAIVHVRWANLEFAMPVSVFFASIAAAAECSRGFRPWERNAEVVGIADHAATGRSSK